jgi:Zinc carboxypeptidase
VLNRIVLFIILTFVAACQPTSVLPTLIQLPGASPARLPIFSATRTPRPITVLIPTVLPTPLPSLTASPVVTQLPASRPSLAPPPITPSSTLGTPHSALNPSPTATVVLTRPPAANTFVVGQSVEGRDILGWRFGAGGKVLLLVGGVHTGFESNTVMLLNELVAHFEGTPLDVLPGMTLILIPVLNPDGLRYGRNLRGRFNANEVDLNRNWGCEWSPEAYFQQERVNPGPRAFSEPETQALARLIRAEPPAAALFYHSAASGVFSGDCEGGNGSEQLAAVLGEASGYAYGEAFTAYKVTGTEASWLDGQGIPAADVELSGTRATEFVRNLKGIMAVQCWLTGNPPLPPCAG